MSIGKRGLLALENINELAQYAKFGSNQFGNARTRQG
jgi:hypothetical protein